MSAGTDIASLGVEIDSTQVQTLTQRQDEATESGARLEEQTYRIQGRTVNLAEALRLVAAQRAKEAEEARKQADALAFQDRQIQQILARYDPLGAKMRALLADQQRLRAALGDSVDPAVMKAFQGLEEDISKVGKLMEDAGAKGEAAGQHMGLGSAYARRELIILGREAMEGNFSRIPASMLTLAAHTGLFSSALIAATASVLPFVAAIAVFVKLQADIEGLNRKIGATQALMAGVGNQGMVSAAQVAHYSEEMRRAGTATEEESFKAIEAFSKQGAIGSELFGKLVKLVPDFARAMGEDVPAAAEKLAKSFGDPLSGVLALDKELNFLTFDEYKTVQAMKNHIDTAGVQRVAIEALQRRMEGMRDEGLTPLQKAWVELKNTWRGSEEPDRQSTAMSNLAKNLSLLADAIRTARDLWKGFVGLMGGMALGGAEYKPPPDYAKEHAKFVEELAAQDARAEAVAKERYEAEQRRKKELYELQQKMAVSDIENSVKIHDIQAKEDKDHQDALLAQEQITQKAHDDEVFRIEYERLQYQMTAEKRLSGLASLSAEEQHAHANEMKRIQEEIDALTRAKKDKDDVRSFNQDQDALDEEAKNTKFLDDTLKRLDFTVKGITDSIDAETASLGMSSKEKKVNAELAKIQNDLAEKGIYLSPQTVAGIKAVIAAHLDLQQAQQENIQTYDKLSSIGASFFADLALHGRSAFESLKKSLESFAAEIIALFAKRYILNMVASLTGDAGIGALAATAGQGTAASGILNMLGLSGTGGLANSGVMALGGIGGTGSTSLGLYSAFANSGAGQGLGLSVAGMTEEGVLGGSVLTGTGMAIAEAIPYIGWAIALGTLAYSLFGGKGGGPKTGGSFMGSFSGAGDFLGNVDVPGKGRFFTPNQGDSNLATVGQSLGLTFAQTLVSLGGKPGGNMSFGVGFDTDPQGTANSRVSGMVIDSKGNTIFRDLDRDIGRTNDPSGEITLELKRELLAGLQASDLPQEVADILKPLDAMTATAEQIDKAVTAAQDMANVLKVIGTINIKGLNVDAIKAWQHDGENLTQTLSRIQQAYNQFDNAFMSDSQKLQSAQAAVSVAFKEMNIAVPQSKEEFYNLVHSIDVSTESGRHLVEQLMAVAPAFLTVSEAAAQAMDRFNSVASSLSPAFGSQFARASFEAALAKWHSVDTAGAEAAPMTTDQAFSFLQQQQSSGFAGFAAYAQGIGGTGALDALTGLLSAFQQYQNSLSQGNTAVDNSTSSVNTFTGAVDAAATAAAQEAAQRAQLSDSLKDWVNKTLSGPLSTLSDGQKLTLMQEQFNQTLSLAKGGDLLAEGQLSKAADDYLAIARQVYGSGFDYSRIFREVVQQVGGVAGLGPQDVNSKLASALPSGTTLASSKDMGDLISVVGDLAIVLTNSGLSVSDPDAKQKLEEIKALLARGSGGILNTAAAH